MIRKPTWILLAIFAVGAALVWYLEFTPSRAEAHQTPSPTAVAKLLPGIDGLNVTRIEVNQTAGKKVAVVRNSKGEYIFQGETGKEVDQGAVFEMASELAAMQVIDTIQSNLSEETLGLSTPAASILVEGANGTKYSLKIGKTTPVGNGYYLKVNAQPSVVVSKEAVDRILSMASVETLAAPTATPPGTPDVATPTP